MANANDIDSPFEIYHVRFKTQYKLTSSLLRFQEHYESPEFRNKVFDLEEFMDWYVTSTKHGTFSYYEDWSGFNFPSSVFQQFCNGSFKNLTRKEEKFLALFAGMHHRFYVIATYENANASDQEQTIAHEIIHALYFTNAKYAEQVNTILSKYDLEKFKTSIKEMGYHPDVINDECNAYILTGLSFQIKRKNVKNVRDVKKELIELFIKEFGINPTKKKGKNVLSKLVKEFQFDTE